MEKGNLLDGSRGFGLISSAAGGWWGKGARADDPQCASLCVQTRRAGGLPGGARRGCGRWRWNRCFEDELRCPGSVHALLERRMSQGNCVMLPHHCPRAAQGQSWEWLAFGVLLEVGVLGTPWAVVTGMLSRGPSRSSLSCSTASPDPLVPVAEPGQPWLSQRRAHSTETVQVTMERPG